MLCRALCVAGSKTVAVFSVFTMLFLIVSRSQFLADVHAMTGWWSKLSRLFSLFLSTHLILADVMRVIVTVLWWQPRLLQLLGLPRLPSCTTLHAVHGPWIRRTVSWLWVSIWFLNNVAVCIVAQLCVNGKGSSQLRTANFDPLQIWNPEKCSF